MSVRKTRYVTVLRAGVSVLLLMLVFTALPIRGESGIYDSVIRLHVIADSNEESDQRMKLFVRDRILSECASVLISEEKNAKSAVLSLSADMSMVKETAARAHEDYCAENGVSDIPTVAKASSTRFLISSDGIPRFSGPKATSSSTIVATSWLSGFWNTIPTRLRNS